MSDEIEEEQLTSEELSVLDSLLDKASPEQWAAIRERVFNNTDSTEILIALAVWWETEEDGVYEEEFHRIGLVIRKAALRCFQIGQGLV